MEKIKYFVACHPKMYSVEEGAKEHLDVELIPQLKKIYDLQVDFTSPEHDCIKNKHYDNAHKKYDFDDDNHWEGEIKFKIRLIPKNGMDEPEPLDPIIVND